MRALCKIVAASIAACFAQTVAVAEQPPPWNASATTTIVQEEKVFHSAGAELSGTLYLPRGGKALAAVVVTHAASLPLRDQPLYRHLKEMLPSLGIAVFLYDRRGSGRSGGDLKASDYTLLADDAIAAVRAVNIDLRIDPRRVGIWGLSQGGWLALLAASRSPQVAFAVSISAPMVTPDLQMIFLSANILRVNGYSQADIDQAIATRKAVAITCAATSIARRRNAWSMRRRCSLGSSSSTWAKASRTVRPHAGARRSSTIRRQRSTR
jgi:uncharacterized protein